ncbi:MAG: ATP-binding cassette domain-containing protein [Candidatus Eisenbacteria sp.]|nr:ATP-binding cassette domain-containing protein [Candidatus Eisenbacteria bacterium]
MATVPAIELQQVSFAYNTTPVVADVDLRVPAGDFACMVGPNGGGKTTLLKLILGLLRPARGELRVLGRSPEKVRHRIGYVPQLVHHDPLFPVTVGDVVLMGRLGIRGRGHYSQADRQAAQQALAEVQLAQMSPCPLATLSGGQRQRVLIARALCGDPQLLLLDEPTANVDTVAQERFFDILQELNRRMTIVLVSHDLGFVSRRVKTVICVNRRVIVHPTSELTGEHIRAIYGSDTCMIRHDHHHRHEEARDG